MKKILFILLCIFLLNPFFPLNAQVQVGASVYGPNIDSHFGGSTAISADGTRMIVGAPGDSSGILGHAQVYELNGSSWMPLGPSITGTNLFPQSFRVGKNVSISNDGDRVAIMSSNAVQIYQWNTSVWALFGPPISTSGINYGGGDFSMDFSGDGNTIIIGNGSANSFSGVARIYEFNGISWQTKGATFSGNPGDRLGFGVTINEDGNFIAIGSPKYSGGNHEGRVQTYFWDTNTWVQYGPDIVTTSSGTGYLEAFGEHIAFNQQGNRIGVSSRFKASMFEFSAGNWNPIGSEVSFFYSPFGSKPIAVSGFGDIFAVGDSRSHNSTGLNDVGIVRVFRIDNLGNQSQYGSTIEGTSEYDLFGYDLDLSLNGERLVSGAIQSLASPIPDSLGYASVFQMPEICDWEKNVSLNLNGDFAGDQYGTAVDYSTNGRFVIVGAPRSGFVGYNEGAVKVFQKINNTWVQRGGSIRGEATGDKSGGAVAISDDGKYILVGAMSNDGGGQNAGHVRMYEWNGTFYAPHGADLDGAANFDYFGYSLDISSSGDYFVVGSPFTDANNKNNVGKVQVYIRDPVNHIPLGQAIFGNYSGDNSGKVVCMSAKGFRVAIGTQDSDKNGQNSGLVGVYDYHSNSNSWQRVGNTLFGQGNGNFFGSAIAFSHDAQTIAIGAFGANTNGYNSGEVKVFSLSGKSWQQKGQTLIGNAAGDYFGRSLDLTQTGNRLVVGAPYSDVNGNNAGSVTVFDLQWNTWFVKENVVNGDAPGDYFGVAVSIHGKGTSYVVGARGADINGGANSNSGQVQTIETCFSNTKSLNNGAFNLESQEDPDESIANKIITKELTLFPNPVQNNLAWKIEDHNIKHIQVFNLTGQLVLEKEVNQATINVKELPSGSYFIKLMNETDVFQKKFIKK